MVVDILGDRAAAILWAQFRSLLNFYRRPQMGGFWVGTIVMVVWYGMVAAGAVGLAYGLSRLQVQRFDRVSLVMTFGFLIAFLYWQVVPVFLASTGLSLETKKLMVYPIPLSQMFRIEVLLRMSTGAEVLLLLAGLFVGLLANPGIPFWAPFTILLFVAFNLFLSLGVKDLIGRLLERKGAREAVVLVVVVLTVTPQMVTLLGLPPAVKEALLKTNQTWLPWALAANLALGKSPALMLPLMAVWTALAWWFGRWQFEKSLRFDVEAVRAKEGHGGTTSGRRWFEWFFRLPGKLLRDPLGMLVEKELRSLARSSRFRLVFFMGFTFGIVVWMPLAFGRFGTRGGPMESNFLTWVSVYSVMVLGEVALFNHFGFDRAAAQLYWLAPVPMRSVLRAKNIAATVYIFLELAIISLVTLLLRLPVTIAKIAEAFAVTVVFALFLTALGNIGSVYYPRGTNPQNSWRSRSGGQFQLWMLLMYPVLAVPISLAYLARYAFESQAAFFAVLGATAVVGMIFQHVAMDTAIEATVEKKEKILTALAQGDGPIS